MKLIFAGILAGLLATTAAKAEDMVFTSWGGTTQEAQTKSWAEPFAAASGIKVLQDGPTDYGKLKAMVDAGSVTRAARLLGVTHQGLAFILNGRQKGLLSSRKPAKRRRRSIIRFH